MDEPDGFRPKDVLVGCCGWALRQADYVRRYPIVEIQQTFYDPPREATLVRWREAAPEGFVFTMKAWQLVTHPASSPTYRRLRRPLPGCKEAYGSLQGTPEVEDAWRETVRAARILGARLVLLQTPASFRPTQENLTRMRRFLRDAERGPFVLAWEPRGPWPEEVVRDLCRELDLVHAVDPFVAQPVWGDLQYLRLHGVGGYGYRYTDADLNRLRGLIRPPAWVLFNNVSMAADAARFQALLGGG
ncbi:DUF72 domain-containing protein [Caldinitratiruptor microaerophilus]|uniref:DUF72 domain-containing protein n=1 Tax=Caldinitratiruptor microaerophilus TaxID=671077 RepID=A0AA35G5M2_9FIRM|nr:DUF72 domain-containing protein [Caldinitratiruptor microaerophilus]BDG59701.1 hypothetical protein caldi_07910 [Caldinitratiruptor microaerophilus]